MIDDIRYIYIYIYILVLVIITMCLNLPMHTLGAMVTPQV